MTEPTIVCPNCQTEIRLTESLAAPLIAASREAIAGELQVRAGRHSPDMLNLANA